jgi:flagellar P-ring protein precursor FlgI
MNMMKTALMTLLVLVAGLAQAERVKDIATVAGVRSNQLVGYGLVVGLDGSGDQTSQTPFTVQSLKSMLAQLGVTIPPDVNPQLKNVAAVSIHSSLPAFAKPGQTIDVNVSSLGNAKSLRGGSLLMTPLRGADGNVYAIAQGNLVVGGLSASGSDGSKVTVNIPSAGRIPNGATVERAVPNPFQTADVLVLNLNSSDFTTATRLAGAINTAIGAGAANALDAASVQVQAPRDPSQRVAFVSMLENLTLDPGDAAARVIINSRTGTVVIGSHVRVMPAAVSHGSLTVTITEKPIVSQPGALSGGVTAVVPQADVAITDEGSRMFKFDPGVTLDEIVRAVNNVGAAPSDLVAILEALKAAGALRAELMVI